MFNLHNLLATPAWWRVLAVKTGQSAGDYGAIAEGAVVAVVERRTVANLATSFSDETLAFQLQRLAEVGRSAVVSWATTPTYSKLSRGGDLGWRISSVAWPCATPEVPIVFAGSRRFAEEWDFRFVGEAIAGGDGFLASRETQSTVGCSRHDMDRRNF